MPLKITSVNQLGAVLRETRTGLKIHAEELAFTADMAPKTLRRLEAGEATKALQSLFKVLDELGIELYLSPPPQVPPITLPHPDQPPKRRRVVA